MKDVILKSYHEARKVGIKVKSIPVRPKARQRLVMVKEHFSFQTNCYIKGFINVSQPLILFFSISFDKGWTSVAVPFWPVSIVRDSTLVCCEICVRRVEVPPAHETKKGDLPWTETNERGL
jgi:hypothetical protein